MSRLDNSQRSYADVATSTYYLDFPAAKVYAKQLMKGVAFLLTSSTATAVAQPTPSIDSQVSFTLQSHPDLQLESTASGSPSPAWSGVITRSSISSMQSDSFRKIAPRLDYPGPGYRILSKTSE